MNTIINPSPSLTPDEVKLIEVSCALQGYKLVDKGKCCIINKYGPHSKHSSYRVFLIGPSCYVLRAMY